MNKTMILFFIVCIISVHAFVKREEPKQDNYLEEIGKKIQDSLSQAGNFAAQNLNPDVLKKGFDQFINDAKKIVGNKPTEQPSA